MIVSMGILSMVNFVWNKLRPYEKLEFPLSKILDHSRLFLRELNTQGQLYYPRVKRQLILFEFATRFF